jgi:hypothetical protein
VAAVADQAGSVVAGKASSVVGGQAGGVVQVKLFIAQQPIS